MDLVQQKLVIDAEHLVLQQSLVSFATFLVLIWGRTLRVTTLSFMRRCEEFLFGCVDLRTIIGSLAYEPVDLRI